RAKDEKKVDRSRAPHVFDREREDQALYHRRGEGYETPRAPRPRSPTRSYYSERSHYHIDLPLESLREKERTSSISKYGKVGQRTHVSQRISHGQVSVHSRLGDRVWVEKGSQSQISHTPPPNLPREPMIISQEVNSSLERRPVLERLALPVARTLLPDGDDLNVQKEPSTQERMSALQRLTPPSNARVPLLLNGVANSDSGRLQEVEVQYLEDTFPTHILNTSGGPSSSRPPTRERLTLPQESPIRSLSGDRRHLAEVNMARVTEEEANLNNSNLQQAPPSKARKATTSKATGKRKASERPPPKRRVAHSPLQGVSLKKRRVSKVQNSPRGKPANKRDPSSNITIHQNSENRCIVGSAFIAEAIAVKVALLEAAQLGLRTLTIHPSSTSYQQGRGILKHNECCLILSTYKLNNAEADSLVKQALWNLSNSV
ncbi:hypothetical protein HID58_049892, partial [Brassica napus]